MVATTLINLSLFLLFSLCPVLCCRCDEYIVQLAKQKKDASSLRDETKLLDGMLNKAISQKLALTEKLENYELELHQLQLQQLQREKVAQKDPTAATGASKPTTARQPSSLMSSRLRFIRNRGKKTEQS